MSSVKGQKPWKILEKENDQYIFLTEIINPSMTVCLKPRMGSEIWSVGTWHPSFAASICTYRERIARLLHAVIHVLLLSQSWDALILLESVCFSYSQCAKSDNWSSEKYCDLIFWKLFCSRFENPRKQQFPIHIPFYNVVWTIFLETLWNLSALKKRRYPCSSRVKIDTLIYRKGPGTTREQQNPKMST